MIREFRNQNKMNSVQCELNQMIAQLKECDKSSLRTELMKSAKEMKKKVDKEVKESWKNFVGKDRVLVNCPTCNGDGYTLKYVGISCGDAMGASPYTHVRCSNCKGDRRVLVQKAAV